MLLLTTTIWSSVIFLTVRQQEINVRGNMEDGWRRVVKCRFSYINQLCVVTWEGDGLPADGAVGGRVLLTGQVVGRKQEDERECDDHVPGAMHILEEKLCSNKNNSTGNHCYTIVQFVKFTDIISVK